MASQLSLLSGCGCLDLGKDHAHNLNDGLLNLLQLNAINGKQGNHQKHNNGKHESGK
jgi:hypothetical protein